MIEKIHLTYEKWGFLLSKERPDINSCLADSIMLPSTVQQMKKSPVTDERSTGYLTDPHRFEGYALYERTVKITPKKQGCRAYLVMERTRTSSLWIDGAFVGTQNSLCTAHRYDITDFVNGNEIRVTIMIDNVSCPVGGGHMTSVDTQTNWLGITGGLYIEFVNEARFVNPKLYTDAETKTVTVRGGIVGAESLELTVDVSGFPKKTVIVTKDCPEFTYEMERATLWSEHNPVNYIMNIANDGDVQHISFGIRSFATRGTEFVVNGEKVFLRGKHDGMIFPMTGAAPTDTESWLAVMKTAKEHGINHYRFHTCCPPEAAFCAADELGIYMEPELPFWGTVEEEITEGQQYLIDEGFRILDEFGNHPSFFALSLGNELWGSKERLNDILGGYKNYDSRHLYTQGSNNFQFFPCVVENDDFFVGVRFSRERLFRGSYAMCDAPLGHIQTDAPNSDYSYDAHIRPSAVGDEQNAGGTIEIQYGTGVKTVSLDNAGGEFISEVPVVSHEVGQYFMYPDYNEIEKYTGVLKPYNLEIFRERLEQAGMLKYADKFFRASGRFAAECYKNEIETALRSKELSGFQLLDIQDFTGQGTALVGVLNSFMESKGVITSVEWRGFCSERVILGLLPKFVFAAGEKLEMPVQLYNYAAKADVDPTVSVRISVNGDVISEYAVNAKGEFKGGTFDLGKVELEIPMVRKPAKAVLTLNCRDICNKYVLWVYPEAEASVPENVVVAKNWAEAKCKLENGGRVLFIPETSDENRSVEGTYCTDFWNYPMFRSISESMNKAVPVGTLGLLVENKHPALEQFPSETYSTAQWYDVVSSSRAVILDGTGIEPIVRTIDNCERNHNLGTVFEVKTNGGSLLVCTARLDAETNSLPCRQLMRSLLDYAASDSFKPEQTVPTDVLDAVFA